MTWMDGIYGILHMEIATRTNVAAIDQNWSCVMIPFMLLPQSMVNLLRLLDTVPDRDPDVEIASLDSDLSAARIFDNCSADDSDW